MSVLELGAGATGIPGIAALKCGSKHVTFTDHPKSIEALELLEENCQLNELKDNSYSVKGLDWDAPKDVERLIENLKELHFVFASDVFYDPSVFTSLVTTLSQIFEFFPNALCLFTYEERDCDWSIEDLLMLKNLHCFRIRSIDTNLHTIHIGGICTEKAYSMSASIFAGIEGGATHSKLVLVDATGKHYGEWANRGLNYYLEGFENVADIVAEWIRKVKAELGIVGPLGALGIGSSGAEDDAINEQLVAVLEQKHGDVANEFYFGSDSVVTIAASFEKGGVILIAGTGSSCRLLKADGSVYGVGGWGHMFSDGGSGFWISNKMIKYIFDDDDGLYKAPAPVACAKQLLLKHFNLVNIVGMLDYLYSKFEKAKVASFAAVLAKDGRDDPLVRIVFREAGEVLGHHTAAISRHFDQEMLDEVPIVAVGSIFKSWDLMREGFVDGIRSKTQDIKCVKMHRLEETPALGAAILAAKKVDRVIPRSHTSSVFDVIDF